MFLGLLRKITFVLLKDALFVSMKHSDEGGKRLYNTFLISARVVVVLYIFNEAF